MNILKSLCVAFILLTGFNANVFSQETLPEVTVVSMNYKYLKSVHDTATAQPVRLLERRAATYDIKKADFYEEEQDEYFVSFYIPQGQILAFYDKNGKVLHTAERYKDIALPQSVRKAIAERYPNWTIASDVYMVNYYGSDNTSKKVYKILLENGTKRVRVKADEKGQFID
ncbi:MAG: nicotinate-nucleotide adenylyltransferase [bacterium]|jgi:hypothetical protein